MTLADDCERIAEETKGGDRLKTADLVNLEFIVSGYAVEDKTKDGAPVVDDMGIQQVSYVGHIILNGDAHEAWLDGKTVRPQLEQIRKANGFPAKVKLIKDEQRYVLRILDFAETANGATTTTALTHKAALAAHMKANGLTASDVLRRNNAAVGEDVAKSWSDYMERETTLGGISEDEVCRQILAELQADAEAIPFG